MDTWMSLKNWEALLVPLGKWEMSCIKCHSAVSSVHPKADLERKQCEQNVFLRRQERERKEMS